VRQLANSAARRRATPAKLFQTSPNLLIGHSAVGAQGMAVNASNAAMPNPLKTAMAFIDVLFMRPPAHWLDREVRRA
jgi:hypothetical protein